MFCLRDCLHQHIVADCTVLILSSVPVTCASVRPEIVNCVAFGARSAKEVDGNVALCGKTVPLELWKEAQAAGIMDPRLPLPGEDAEPAAKKAKN